MRAKKTHKTKWRWQNQFWVIVVPVFQPNASHLTPNYFMVIYKRSWADNFEIVFMSISHPSGSLKREHKILEKRQYFTCSTQKYLFQEFWSVYWHLLYWKAGFFYCTCLKVSQKQVFFNDQTLFNAWPKSGKLKLGGDFQSYLLH